MTEKNPETNNSGLKADISMESIRNLFSKKKGVKDETGAVVPDNSQGFVPKLPEVNLLPPNVKESYAAKDLMIKFFKGSIVLVAIFAVAFVGSTVSNFFYDQKINKIETETAGYQTEINQLNPYADYRTQLETKRSNLADAVETQVDASKVMAEFSNAASKAGYSVDTMSFGASQSVDGSSGGEGSCVNPDPFNPSTGIGCISFELKGSKNADINKLYTQIKESKSSFINLYVPSATQGDDGSASIQGSVSIGDNFRSHKYDGVRDGLDPTVKVEDANQEEGN